MSDEDDTKDTASELVKDNLPLTAEDRAMIEQLLVALRGGEELKTRFFGIFQAGTDNLVASIIGSHLLIYNDREVADRVAAVMNEGVAWCIKVDVRPVRLTATPVTEYALAAEPPKAGD